MKQTVLPLFFLFLSCASPQLLPKASKGGMPIEVGCAIVDHAKSGVVECAFSNYNSFPVEGVCVGVMALSQIDIILKGVPDKESMANMLAIDVVLCSGETIPAKTSIVKSQDINILNYYEKCLISMGEKSFPSNICLFDLTAVPPSDKDRVYLYYIQKYSSITLTQQLPQDRGPKSESPDVDQLNLETTE